MAAHVEFARAVQNPIGLKCGPSYDSDDLKLLMHKLTLKTKRRLPWIARFRFAGNVGEHLPRFFIKTVQEEARTSSGTFDAMPQHGFNLERLKPRRLIPSY